MELLTIPAITAIAQAIKMAGMPSKFMPLTSIATGVVLALFFVDGELMMKLGAGIFIGLAASGLYDNMKPQLEKVGLN